MHDVDSMERVRNLVFDLIDVGKEILPVEIVNDLVDIDTILEHEIQKWRLYFSHEITDLREIEAIRTVELPGTLELVKMIEGFLRETPNTEELYGDIEWLAS